MLTLDRFDNLSLYAALDRAGDAPADLMDRVASAQPLSVSDASACHAIIARLFTRTDEERMTVEFTSRRHDELLLVMQGLARLVERLATAGVTAAL